MQYFIIEDLKGEVIEFDGNGLDETHKSGDYKIICKVKIEGQDPMEFFRNKNKILHLGIFDIG
jgi:hypothetical protein